MFVIRLFQWPCVVIAVCILALMISVAAGAWFNTDEYVFHLQR